MRAFKFIKKLKYSTVRLLREYFSNVQTIIKKKKPWAMCNFQKPIKPAKQFLNHF